MKKRIRLTALVICVLFATILATGCHTDYSDLPPVSVAEPFQPPPGAVPPSVDIEPAITEEAAKEIALEKAGLTADQVVFDRVELDRDDGRIYYEVEFRQDRTEYSADVDATDGTIYDWEVDYD